MQNFNDQAYMAEAIRLAKKGLFTTRNNPRVGCVIVKNTKIIGSGFHVASGQNHAEVEAINNAVENTEGATLYVNLEPCTHQGNTPPCVDSLIKAKISRAVIAMQDPNPLVNGKGVLRLQEHGIDVTIGVLESQAEDLNKGFIKRYSENRPYVTVKTATSLDGKTALASGDSKWITGEQARADVQRLRARSCAILTGIETVLKDDPQLTVRIPNEELGVRNDIEQPVRVVLDTNLRIPAEARVLRQAGKTIICTCNKNIDDKLTSEKQKVEFQQTSKKDNRVDLSNVIQILTRLEINEVLVEAGPILVGNLLEHQLVDEMVMYIAPHVLGDSSRGFAVLDNISSMEERINFDIIEVSKVGNDLKITLKPKNIH